MNHSRSILFAILISVMASVWADHSPPTREQRVDALFAQFDRRDSPGVAVGIFQNGKVLYCRGYGMADLEQGVAIGPDTIFHVASVSKHFTAFAVALLARDGKLRLDDDVRTYLPYVPDFGSVIRVRHLIHHTSGLRDQWDLFALGGKSFSDVLDTRQVINMISRQRTLNFTPGSATEYSNTGYTLLGEIVHATSGQTLREFTTQRMFQPLGMTHTFFYDDVTEIVPGREIGRAHV